MPICSCRRSSTGTEKKKNRKSGSRDGRVSDRQAVGIDRNEIKLKTHFGILLLCSLPLSLSKYNNGMRPNETQQPNTLLK